MLIDVQAPVLTRSAQAGLSTKLFFFKYCEKASMKSLAERSLTVKKVCGFSPNMVIKILKNIIYIN